MHLIAWNLNSYAREKKRKNGKGIIYLFIQIYINTKKICNLLQFLPTDDSCLRHEDCVCAGLVLQELRQGQVPSQGGRRRLR